MMTYQPPSQHQQKYYIPTAQGMQTQLLHPSRNTVTNPNYQQFHQYHHVPQVYYNFNYPQQEQHFNRQQTIATPQTNHPTTQKSFPPTNNYQTTPYQSSNSTPITYRITTSQVADYPTPSHHSYHHLQHQATTVAHTPSQPFSSSTTYSQVGGFRAPNLPSTYSYNPSQQYGYTSSSTVVNRISHNDHEDRATSQRSLSQLSRIRSQLSKPNIPPEKEKIFADAINKKFNQEFATIQSSNSNMKFPTQTARLLKHVKADVDEIKPPSSQQMFCQSTQTSMIQPSQPTYGGSQYSQTEHYMDQAIQTLQKIPPTHQSQLVQPTSLRGNISSDDRLMPPPSNLVNASMNSSRISNSFHSSSIATPPLLQPQPPTHQTNISQYSQRTPSNPPVLLSSSFMSTPKSQQNMLISDQQQQPVLDPCSQLSPSIGPLSQIHNTPPTYNLISPINHNMAAQQMNSSEPAWGTPLVHVPVMLRSPPNSVVISTNNNSSFIQNHPVNPINQNEVSANLPPQQFNTPTPNYYHNNEQISANVTNEAVLANFPPQYSEQIHVTNEIFNHSHIRNNESHQNNMLEEEKIRRNSIIADINMSKALSEEGKAVTVVSDSKSSSEELHEDDDSNNVESEIQTENNEMSQAEFEKAIREALKKARGFAHDVQENNTELLGWKKTREFYEYSERRNWKNRVTKTRPSIFHRRRYHLKSISKSTTSRDIVQIIEERLKQPTEMSPAKTTSTTPKKNQPITPKSTITKKKQQTPDLNILSTPLISPIPKNFYNHNLNIVPSDADIREDFHLMKKLTSVKNLYTDEDDEWNYEFSTNNSRPSEFSGLINEFISSYGYDGRKIHSVDNQRIAFICGRGVRFINLETKEEHYFVPDIYISEDKSVQDSFDLRTSVATTNQLYLTAGISAIAFSKKRRVFAVADTYSHPKIRIYDLNTFEVLKVLSGGSVIDFLDLDFSRDGSFLLSLSGIPDHQLTVWDWDSGRILIQTQAPNTTKYASFNPRNKLQICSSGFAHLAFWIVNPIVDGYDIIPVEPKVSENIYEKIKTTELYRHEWGTNNDILCVTNDGDFLRFENIHSNGVILDLDDSRDAMYNITLCRHSCIVGLHQGALKVYRMSTINNAGQRFDDEDRISSRVISLNNKLGDISSVCISGNFKYIIAGTVDGSIFKVYIKGFETDTITDLELMKNDVSVNCVYDSHIGAVTGVYQLEPQDSGESNKSIVVSHGMDGTIRVWNYKTNALIAKRKFNALFSCGQYSNGLLFVGSSIGFLRVFEFDEKHQPIAIYSHRLRTSAITSIKIGGKNGTLVAVSFADSTLGFLRLSNAEIENNNEDIVVDMAMEDDDEFLSLIGFCKFNHNISTLAWSNETSLYVATEVGDLYLVEPPVTYEEVILLTNITKDMWKLDYPCYGMAPFKDDPNHIYTLSQDKTIKIYDLNVEDRQSGMSNNVVTPSSETLCHHKTGEWVVLSSCGRYLCTGAKDGVVSIRIAHINFFEQNEEEGASESYYLHNSMNGGVSSISFSYDSTTIFSSGYDGSICVYSLDPSENLNKNSFAMSIPKVQPKDKCSTTTESPDFKTILEIKTDNQNKVEQMMKETKKEQAFSQIDELRKLFFEIKAENDQAPEDERLSESEFIIDEDYKKMLEREGEKECEKLKEVMHVENVKKDILAKKIKKECWDSMEEHSTTIIAFKMASEYQKEGIPLEVPNYVIRKRDPKREVILEKISFMRRMEEISLVNRRKEYITNDIEGGVPEEEEYEEKSNKRTSSRTSEISENRSEDESELRKTKENIRKNLILDLDGLLYPYTDLYTRQRKVTQIFLLQEKVDKMKRQFNGEFKTVREEKTQIIRKIESMNEKILDISKDLNRCSDAPIPVEIFDVKLKPQEKPEQYILQVSEDELPKTKFVRSDDKSKKQDNQKNTDPSQMQDKDTAQRALQMMMDGKLDLDTHETKEEEIPIPAAIGKERSELTEQEMKELKEYESLMKQKEEERIKKVKQLEAKLNNAKQQIADLCQEFDTNLKVLFLKKQSTDQSLFEIELQMVKLSQSIIQHEEFEKAEKQLEKILEELKNKKAQSSSAVQEYHKRYELEKAEHEKLILEDRQMERSFKTQFQRDILQVFYPANQQALSQMCKKMMQQKTQSSVNMEFQKLQHAANMKIGEMFEKLYKIFRTRSKPQTNQDNIDLALNSVDPFADVDATEEAKNAPPEDPLDEEKSRPIYIADDELWARFWEIRESKVLMDNSVRESQQRLDEMRVRLDKLTKEDKDLDAIMSLEMTELTKFRDKIVTESYNMDKIFRFKQGQVEVEQAAVVTDYSDAILIFRSTVEDHNSNIRQQGQEIVKQLTKMKDLKKKIRKIQWENDLIAFDTEEMIIKFKRLQMLKVKKEMQEIIKSGGGTEEKKKMERAKLQKQIENVKAALETALEEKKRILKKMEDLMHVRYEENTNLIRQIKIFEQVVEERAQLNQIQSATKEKEAADKRMTEIRWERKLQDLARDQKRELDILTEELERLKKRSFPSFAVVERRKM